MNARRSSRSTSSDPVAQHGDRGGEREGDDRGREGRRVQRAALEPGAGERDPQDEVRRQPAGGPQRRPHARARGRRPRRCTATIAATTPSGKPMPRAPSASAHAQHSGTPSGLATGRAVSAPSSVPGSSMPCSAIARQRRQHPPSGAPAPRGQPPVGEEQQRPRSRAAGSPTNAQFSTHVGPALDRAEGVPAGPRRGTSPAIHSVPSSPPATSAMPEAPRAGSAADDQRPEGRAHRARRAERGHPHDRARCRPALAFPSAIAAPAQNSSAAATADGTATGARRRRRASACRSPLPGRGHRAMIPARPPGRQRQPARQRWMTSRSSVGTRWSRARPRRRRCPRRSRHGPSPPRRRARCPGSTGRRPPGGRCR